MMIATWNVNSVRARLPRLLAWLAARSPDAVCLQEVKAAADSFPTAEIERAGYRAAVFGQRAYNGVAILSREEPMRVERGFDDGEDDPQARLVGATVSDVRILSVYVPNGEVQGSPKYAYKHAWLARLRAHLAQADLAGSPVAVCGDLNIAPASLDVHDPQRWEGTVLFNPKMRAAFAGLTDLGLVDVFRARNEGGGLYSWWDYRTAAFEHDEGLRIDHVLASKPLADRCTRAFVDRAERGGERPSDHAPVVAVFD
jgi:exodeoxyribonuclease III